MDTASIAVNDVLKEAVWLKVDRDLNLGETLTYANQLRQFNKRWIQRIPNYMSISVNHFRALSPFAEHSVRCYLSHLKYIAAMPRPPNVVALVLLPKMRFLGAHQAEFEALLKRGVEIDVPHLNRPRRSRTLTLGEPSFRKICINRDAMPDNVDSWLLAMNYGFYLDRFEELTFAGHNVDPYCFLQCYGKDRFIAWFNKIRELRSRDDFERYYEFLIGPSIPKELRKEIGGWKTGDHEYAPYCTFVTEIDYFEPKFYHPILKMLLMLVVDGYFVPNEKASRFWRIVCGHCLDERTRDRIVDAWYLAIVQKKELDIPPVVNPDVAILWALTILTK